MLVIELCDVPGRLAKGQAGAFLGTLGKFIASQTLPLP
jgi:hypothetical protein